MLDSATELRLTKLLAALVEYKASDLHLTVANPPYVRIDGSLKALEGEELLTDQFLHTIIEHLLPPELLQQLELKHEVATAITFKGKARYTLHAYQQHSGMSVTVRYITPNVQPLSRLTVHTAIQQCLSIQQGLIVITGNYGSGKTALCNAFLEEYNLSRPQHIITFERPIEYIFTDNRAIIEQVEIGRDLPDLETALERVFQEDIDCIAVRTPLDAATVRAILQFLEMGKLVIVEVLASSVGSALQSLLNVFQASEHGAVREVLGNTLEAGIALRPGGACEVLRKSTATINFIKRESYDKIAFIIDNGRADGMISFDQSLK